MTEMDAFNGGKDGVRRLETGDPEMKIARIAEDSRGQPGKNRKGRRQNRENDRGREGAESRSSTKIIGTPAAPPSIVGLVARGAREWFGLTMLTGQDKVCDQSHDGFRAGGSSRMGAAANRLLTEEKSHAD